MAVSTSRDVLQKLLQNEMQQLFYEWERMKIQRRNNLHGDADGNEEHVYMLTVNSVLTSYPSCLERAKKSSQKLFHDEDGFIGTFTYLSSSIGMCAMHCVSVGRKLSYGSDLKVCGHRLKHVASFPYYDLSFYEVLGSDPLPFVEFADPLQLKEGTKVAVAAFPKLDDKYSEAVDEEVVVSYGHIVRMHSTLGYHLATGDYHCSRGSSGGAVLNREGRLLGMHLAMEFYEDTTYFKPEERDITFPEPYYVLGQDTFLRNGAVNNSGKAISDASPAVLAKYAALNTAEKCGFACFLPVDIIKNKFEFIASPYVKIKSR